MSTVIHFLYRRLNCSGWLGACLALILFGVDSASAALVLSDGGKSDYRIVLPASAIPAERRAAEELQHYLEKIGGVRLSIVSDTEPGAGHEILLGDNYHLSKARGKIDFTKLGPDGFVLRTDAKRLIIAGGRPRGTLNGVDALLEEKLGVRWFTPELETVPKVARLQMPSLDETRIPVLQNRDVFWRETMRNADFASRHHLNGQHYSLTEQHGGAFAVYFPFVHSFDALIPVDLFEAHPEYFPLIDGKRKNGYVQRCLSNPDVLKLAIDRVRQWIKEHPEASIISVSQNDTINNCQCPPCKAIDDAEGSPAGSLLTFVNAIAENIEQDHPHIRLDTLAYQYTRKPPKTIRPRPNVIVRLCSIECCFSHPLDVCTEAKNARFCEDIIAWQPVAPLLYVWDYTTDFGHYQQPFPNFDALQANVRFFVKHGVKSLFEQGNYSSGGLGEMGPLRAYLLAELLWNPETDVTRHTREFVTAYYGKAGPKILAYLDVIHGPVREEGLHAHIFDRPKADYLSKEVLGAGEKLLDEAEQLAENEDFRFHVQVARLPVWYVRIANNLVDGADRTNLVQRFAAIARKAGISNLSESGSLDDWIKKQGGE